ncbi:Rieske (2Fe-2S) protein [Mucilaginibacter phyllosphaerae]
MKQTLVLILTAMLFFGCAKTGSVVPSVPVKISIIKTDPRYTALNAAGGFVYISGAGVAGIIIYRKVDGTYAAYDRCSSYMPEKLCAITVDDTGFTATDPCSGSKFSLDDGGPVKAPATKYLRSYGVNTTPFEINVYN